MADKLKLGVVGIGGIFNGCHAKPWLEHPEVEIVAVCDVVREKAEKFAGAHGIKHIYTDYRQMLAEVQLDAVDICTSNLFHSEIAIAALDKGLHAFTEKPDAVSPAEAQKMADAAKRSGKVLMAMRNNRFTPNAQFLKKYIAAGHMGDIYTGRCGWIRRRGIPGKGGWFTTKELSGGGPLIDLGVHMLDVAIWLMGNPSPVAVVGATYRKFAEGSDTSDSVHSSFGEAKTGGTFDVEDLASGFIRFDNGASLQIEFSWASNIEQEVNFVELRGSKAGFNLSNSHGTLKIFTEIEGALADVTPKPTLAGPHQHGANLHHFIDVIRGRAEPTTRPEHGVEMIKILSAIYESAQTGAEVKL
ncbi:MAG TPA: Gfo/Idh/MocA family oxidoreductase [Tepidisphaeraceae bacterium]|jgi:predicted dehydrogenase|nr:Gfo/Idh/MocA family oxidoreductase [Tepidisphaeraceae bacterium]